MQVLITLDPATNKVRVESGAAGPGDTLLVIERAKQLILQSVSQPPPAVQIATPAETRELVGANGKRG